MDKEELLKLIDELEDKISKRCLCHNDETLLTLIHKLVEANIELEQDCNK